MPSNRKQLNVRLNDEDIDRLAGLTDRVRADLRLAVSQSDVIRLALIELEKRYPPPSTPAAGARP